MWLWLWVALAGLIPVLPQPLTPGQITISYNKPIVATSTCGEINGAPFEEVYCTLAGSSQYTPLGKYAYKDDESNPQAIQELRNTRELFIHGGHGCGRCLADSENAHPASSMVDGNTSWWMSPPLSRGMQYNAVNITIDLLQEFHVAYIWIQMANSPRPGTWALERSIDYGKTYKPWYYFADNDAECMRRWGVESLSPINSNDQVICRSDLSAMHPLENGEIVLNLLHERPEKESFMTSPVLQNFTRATNIRLQLLGTRTLQGHLMDLNDLSNPTVTRRYFYAIKEIMIGGRCVCNGHASTCDVRDVRRPHHLVCRCEHNTCGDKCDQCCPDHPAKRWRPAHVDSNFTCERCECFGRSNECVFDEEIEKNSLALDIHGERAGGGRCLNCRFNTEGINCDTCSRGYYRPEGRNWTELQPCDPCRCDPSKHNGACAEGTGKCECQERYTGENCDVCAPGFHSPPHCFPCECKVQGTLGEVCQPTDGQCPCKEGYGGKYCEICAPGHTNMTAGCPKCNCHAAGKINDECDATTGVCKCNGPFGGKNCDECAQGYFGFPECKYCDCDPSGTEGGVCDGNNGQCLCKYGFAGRHCEKCDKGFYGYPNCKPCECTSAGALSEECDIKTGDCSCNGNFTGRACDKCAAGFYGYPDCQECSCLIDGAKGQTCDQNGQCFCKDTFQGARCDKCKPNFYNFPLCEACNCHPSGVTFNFRGCDKVAPGELCECRKNVQGRICDQCKATFYDLSSSHRDGCIDCACNVNGTLSRLNTCSLSGGQCSCKRNVEGRNCNKCKQGYYNLQSYQVHGCEACNCDIGGSTGRCDGDTGQCMCKPRIAGLNCDRPAEEHYFPTLWHLKYEAEDGRSPDHRPVRFSYDNSLFPDFSWRGFAVFSPIQDQIIHDVDITIPSVYRPLLAVHNPSNVTLTATLSMTPVYGSAQASAQSVTLSFPPSSSPFILDTKHSFDILANGRWTLKLETKQRLFWDYIVLLPQEYYEGTSLLDSHTKPCEAGAAKNSTSCIDLLFPPLDNGPRADVTKDIVPFMIKDGDGNDVELEMVPVELLSSDVGPAAFVRADNVSRIISASIDVPADDSYVVVLEYHNREKTDLPLNVEIMQGNETKQSGVATIHYCPYATFCRELLTEGGQPLVVPLAQGTAKLSLEVGPMHEFGLAAVNLVREKDWSIQYLQQVPVCVRKDGVCQPLAFPPAPGQTIGAEVGQRESRPVAGDKLPFNIIDAENVVLVPIDNDNPSLEISAPIANPDGNPYYFILVHYYNPDNTPSRVDVVLTTSDTDVTEGFVDFAFCPSVGGCRALIVGTLPGTTLANPQHRLENKYTVQFVGKDMDALKGPIYIDSITAVPFASWKQELLTAMPLDLSGEFQDKCSGDNFKNDPSSPVSDVCKGHIFSLTTNFNNAAFPCECSSQGSTSFSCETYGGQCACKENIMGRRCDRCKPGHFGFPECKKCSCGLNQLCNEYTGQCACPPNVEGKNCDKCVVYAFGYDPLIGCQLCGCHNNGTENGQAVCDAESGQCLCRSQVGGRRCDQCLPGHYRFPHCDACQCNRGGGTTDVVCDATTAECKCRSNVLGPRCDRCRDGTFALAPSHDKGCIDCHCFGVTSRCQSSRLPVITMDIDKSRVKVTDPTGTVTLDTNENVKYTAGENPPKTVYFDIPLRPGKDYSQSYGLKMSFTVSSSVSTAGIGDSQPDVVLTGGNITAHFWASQQPSDPAVPFEVSLHLAAESLVSPDGRPLSRGSVMMLLYRLSSIHLKASHYDSPPTASLIDFSIDSIDEFTRDSVVFADTVERCLCPPGYMGLSCQQCTDGYYRVKTGSYENLGSCVKCECNDHSSTCDKETGVCIDCDHSTYGDHCENCMEGFYGDATTGDEYACVACACPFAPTNNFATACSVSNEGLVESCTCRQGYTGTHCDKCATGYFGYPTESGGSCEPCQCNGNNDLTKDQACHIDTGECFLCENNTAGPSCETCALWFHGDAVKAKNCTACDCDQCGSSHCDFSTGDCQCKPNVIGDNCDRCAPDHFGFSRCGGCHSCHCGVAAASSQCNEATGQCTCRPGATGLRCERCEVGYWNYGEGGCTKCDCDVDLSKNFVCDVSTGQCHCGEGATGPRCDQCLPSYLRIPTKGCRRCDECVFHLKSDVDALDKQIFVLDANITGISAATIDGARLARTQKKLADILETAVLLANYSSIEDTSRLSKATKTLEMAAAARDTLDFQKKQITASLQLIKPLAESQRKFDLDTRERAAEARRVVDQLRDLQWAIESSAGRERPVERWILHGQTILDDIRAANANLTTMTSHSVSAEIAENTAKEVVEKQKAMTARIEEKRNKSKELKTIIEDVKKHMSRVRSDSRISTDLSSRSDAAKFSALADSVDNDEKKTNESMERLSFLSAELRKTQEDMAELGKDLNDTLAALNESIHNADVERNERMKREAGKTPTDTAALREHAHKLHNDSVDIKNKFHSTKNEAKNAVDAAEAYEELATSIKTAEEKAQSAKETGEEEGKNAADLVNEVALARNVSAAQLASTKELEDTSKLKKEHAEIEATRETVDRALKGLRERKERIGEAPRLNQTVKEELEKVMKGGEAKEDKMETLRKKIEDYEEMAASQVEKGNRGGMDLKQTRDNVEKMKEMKTRPKEWERLAETFRNGTHRMGKLNDKLRALKDHIAHARFSLGRIDIPMSFKRGSSLDLKLAQPPAASSVATDISFFIRTKEDGLPLYFGNVQGRTFQKVSTSDYLAVQIKGGRPSVLMNLGGEPVRATLNTPINDDQWHKIVISRVGRNVNLKLTTPNGKVVRDEAAAVAEGVYAVLNLVEATTKMYIGGIPTGVETPFRDDSHFQGAITDIMINGDAIGIWNANENGVIDVGGWEKRTTTETVAEKEFGVADGFLEFPYAATETTTMKMGVSFLSYAPDGLLLYFGSDNKFFTLEVSNGLLKMTSDLGSGVGQGQTENTYTDGKWHSLTIVRNNEIVQLTVDGGAEAINVTIPGGALKMAADRFYIGGVPVSVQTRSSHEPFRGCLRSLENNNDVIDFKKAIKSVGVTPSCPAIALTREVAFLSERASAVFSNVSLSTPLNPQQRFDVAFQFRTRLNSTLIANVRDNEEESILSVSLVNGELSIGGSEGEKETLHSSRLADGNWHYVSISRADNGVVASVDDGYFFSLKTLHLDREQPFHPYTLQFGKGDGGSFIGCVRDVTFGGRVLEFAKSELREVRLTGCQKEVQKETPKEEKEQKGDMEVKVEDAATTPRPPTEATVEIDEVETIAPPTEWKDPENLFPNVCALDTTERNADNLIGERFGTKQHSRVEYTNLPEEFAKQSTISFSVRAEGATAPLVWVGGESAGDFLAIFLLKGRVLFMFNTGRPTPISVASNKVILDGEWHTIKASRTGNYAQLTVDGQITETPADKSVKTPTIDFRAPIYVGGVPKNTFASADLSSFKLGALRTEFSGCIAALSFTRGPASGGVPFGVVPCSQKEEKGLWLGPDGGYAILDNREPIESVAIAIKFRSRVNNGLILSMGKVDHFSLSLEDGAVVSRMVTADGLVTNATSHKLKFGVSNSLENSTYFCDGDWHYAKLFRRKNLLTLSVDGQKTTVVGKSASRNFTIIDPIVVGSPPAGLVHESLVGKSKFIGCLKMENTSGKDTKRKKRVPQAEQLLDLWEDEKGYTSFTEKELHAGARVGCPVI